MSGVNNIEGKNDDCEDGYYPLEKMSEPNQQLISTNSIDENVATINSESPKKQQILSKDPECQEEGSAAECVSNPEVQNGKNDVQSSSQSISRKASRKESSNGNSSVSTRKASKAENHQTISGMGARKTKKYWNSSRVVTVNNIVLKPPETVFYNNKVTKCIEEMTLEVMLALMKSQYGEDTEYLDLQPPEDDKYGNIEYKLKLIKTDERRLQELECQMLRRLDEGVDTCYYHVGLEDNGNPLGLVEEELHLSLKILSHVAAKNGCSFQLDSVFNGERGQIAFVKIKQKPRNIIRADIRIQLMGETGSGKTSLVKTLYYKEPYCSTVHSLQTTSIQQQYLSFDSRGKLLSCFPFNVLGLEGEIELATKIISFVETGGKQRDRKYFVESYCSRLPNYGVLVISAETGLSESDREKIRDAVTMQIVFFIVITKIDVASSASLGKTVCDVKRFIMLENYTKKSVQVVYQRNQIARVLSESFLRGDIVPIFMVASKTMCNIKLLTKFLSQLPDNRRNAKHTESTELTIYNPLDKTTVNNDKNVETLIFQGTVLSGELTLAQKLLIGPDINGLFKKVKVQELMVVKSSVERVQTSQICSVQVSMGLEDKKNFEIRKGQVLVDPNQIPRAAYEFLAELTLFGSVKKDVLIKTGFQPVVSFHSIRQICKIMVTKEDLSGKGYRPLARRKSLEREMTPIASIAAYQQIISSVKAFKSSTQGDKKIEEKTLVFSKNLNKKFLRRTKSIDKMKELLGNEGMNSNSTAGGDVKSQQTIQLAKDNVPVIVIKRDPAKDSQGMPVVKNALNKFEPEVKNYLRMRFAYRPERIQVGQVFYIDESVLKAVGVVKKVFY